MPTGITIDQSKNKIAVFGEIELRYRTERDYNNWTVADFTFNRPSDADFYANMKTDQNVGVQVQYENGFKVYLIGEKAKGGWTKMLVGSLPGSLPTG